METSMIHFNDKHISIAQAIKANDRVLEGFIHNLSKVPIIEIRGYLQDAGFLHTSRMLKGCKLDHTLISMLVERRRKCTITLEDVALQLGLLMKGPVVNGDICKAFLGKVRNKFQGDRIEIKWLETNFKEFPTNATDIVKEQYARAFILRLIRGIVMPDKSKILMLYIEPVDSVRDGGNARIGSSDAPVQEARTTPHSSMEEGDEDEDEVEGGDKDEGNGEDEDEHEVEVKTKKTRMMVTI
ncbi:hypothetical protein J1N35_013561 [Gossypium stocksii]|uniref:Uncharacterized protein n=1 Tax=Gossypium stocksii TaxID=47602 RepID=A0A9D3VSP6_9ROSI|nr:hypothetical protein J1N35_013561 [Gossypium stocksii]